MKKLVLIDANHLMHRAYWAIQRNLSTSSGEQTNAVFGVTSMLITILEREQPDIIIACFDEGKETLRHKEHDAYKAGRAETPDDFYAQIPRVHQCFRVFNTPILSHPDYEADDIIATLAQRGVADGYMVTIVTGDRDLFQMADGSIRIAVPHGGYSEPEYMDAQGVEKKLGARPDQIPDYKGLVGDPSDNLPGVKGIGPKTAVELLRSYGSLEGVYEHLDDIRESVRSKLLAGKESAFFCKRLAILVKDIPLNADLSTFALNRAYYKDIESFFQTMEFHTLKRRLHKSYENSSFMRHFVSGDPVAWKHDEGEVSVSSMTADQLPLLD